MLGVIGCISIRSQDWRQLSGLYRLHQTADQNAYARFDFSSSSGPCGCGCMWMDEGRMCVHEGGG